MMNCLQNYNLKINIKRKNSNLYKNKNLKSIKDLRRYLKWLDNYGTRDFKFHRIICKIKKLKILNIQLIVNYNLVMMKTLFNTIMES